MAEGRFDTARPGGNRAAKTPKGQPCAGINMQFCILSALGMFLWWTGISITVIWTSGTGALLLLSHAPVCLYLRVFLQKGKRAPAGSLCEEKNNPSAGAVYGVQSDVRHDCPGAPQSRLCLWGDLSLWNLFVEPFITGHQFEYNLAAWFVPALFLVEMANVLLRRLLKRVDSEYAVFFCTCP